MLAAHYLTRYRRVPSVGLLRRRGGRGPLLEIARPFLAARPPARRPSQSFSCHRR